METHRIDHDGLRETYEAAALVREYNGDFLAREGRVPKAYTRHFGCQQNVSDGERLDGLLLEMGYTLCDSPLEADLVLYNTCAVRENAEDRIFGNVGALKQAKRQNPGMLVCLCGCMVQQPHIAKKIRASYPYVDLVFGTHAMRKFPGMVYKRLTDGSRQFETEDSRGEIVEGLPVSRGGRIKAFLPIMYGCDNFCTYCVVPLVRGRERSRMPRDILDEAKSLVENGCKDITLLGQNVNSYGKGLDGDVNFSRLLRELAAIDGDFRIRFMTSHPKDCTKELIDAIADCDKICNHIHLPAQSGSDRVLAAMNRRYTRGEYLSLIAYAREKIPGVSFTGDIMVGFPGETYEDFEETLSLVREVGYHSLFTFLYSKREGTKAAVMDDPVPPGEKKRWFNELLGIQQEIGAEKYSQMIGGTFRVLADGYGKTGEGWLTGRSESNVIVDFMAPEDQIGQFVNVEITGALNWAVLGKMIK